MKKYKALIAAAMIVLAAFLVACAPQARDADTSIDADGGSSSTAIAAVDWSPESDCTACHTEYGLAGQSAVHASHDLDCFSCHTVDEMQAIHDEHGGSGKQPNRLKYSEVNDTTCLASDCHISKEAVTERTSASGIAVVDKNGKEVNPHNPPTGVEEHDLIECTDCHSGHKDEAPLELADRKCFGCHHEEVLECGTCHTV